MQPSEWIIPVATFLLGQLSIYLLEWFRNRQTRKQRRDDFQRQTLVELQDMLYQQALDAVMVATNQDQHPRPPGRRTDGSFEDTHHYATLQATMRLPTLVERVEDGEVRALADQLDVTLRRFMMSEKKEGRSEALKRFQDIGLQMNRRIGTLLRSL